MAKYYTKESISIMIREERPFLTDEQISDMAIEIHRALNTLDTRQKRNNKKFYSNTVSYQQWFGEYTQWRKIGTQSR